MTDTRRQAEWTSPDGAIELHRCDCRELIPALHPSDVGITIADPPYGMKKAEWDEQIIPPREWMPHLQTIAPLAVFCGVRGLFDYPRPDWTAAWVRVASTQRNGKLKGFNNWEPLLIYGFKSLANDVFSYPNIRDKAASFHPTPKPVRLIRAILAKSPPGTLFDPFTGSGTAAIAAIHSDRQFIGCEQDPAIFGHTVKRIETELQQHRLFTSKEAA